MQFLSISLNQILKCYNIISGCNTCKRETISVKEKPVDFITMSKNIEISPFVWFSQAAPHISACHAMKLAWDNWTMQMAGISNTWTDIRIIKIIHIQEHNRKYTSTQQKLHKVFYLSQTAEHSSDAKSEMERSLPQIRAFRLLMITTLSCLSQPKAAKINHLNLDHCITTTSYNLSNCHCFWNDWFLCLFQSRHLVCLFADHQKKKSTERPDSFSVS